MISISQKHEWLRRPWPWHYLSGLYTCSVGGNTDQCLIALPIFKPVRKPPALLIAVVTKFWVSKKWKRWITFLENEAVPDWGFSKFFLWQKMIKQKFKNCQLVKQTEVKLLWVNERGRAGQCPDLSSWNSPSTRSSSREPPGAGGEKENDGGGRGGGEGRGGTMMTDSNT